MHSATKRGVGFPAGLVCVNGDSRASAGDLRTTKRMGLSLRKRVFRILGVADQDDVASRVFDIFLVALILINVVAFILESVDSFHAAWDTLFLWIKQVSLILFAVEFGLRVWSCPEHPTGLYRQPLTGRLRYLATPLMVIDAIVILALLLPAGRGVDLRFLRLFRLLGILRITHHSPALGILASVVKRESKTLAAIFILILILLLFTATAIWYIERQAQPEAFASIPRAMWWGISTLTTVGYGDIVPHSAAGKVFGALIMFIGIGMFAVPTGILVTGFVRETKRKDFIATWNLVARVPSFSRLNAMEVANIADLLRLHTAMPKEVIFRNQDVADCMYFIVAGEVEVDLGTETRRLHGGDFFGEVALLYKIRRTATVTARTFTELLRLDARDFETLLESNTALRDKIMAAAEQRVERHPGAGI